MLFKKILIANRGEIACRIIKTAKKLNIQTVAVYSEIDSKALHVQMADEHYCIGPAPSVESYLNGEKIIEVAKKSGAEAIHPGYGFLSEDPDFAQMCQQNSIVFVGPPSSAIRVMGDKDLAKKTMTAAGVPVVPGYQGDMADQPALEKAVLTIGLPVLIKASAGGGGKGMRLVEDLSQLKEAIAGAIREAEASFGDGRVFVEKYLSHSRHIEVQILFDQFGQGLYLFDRDCSIQRRHQKVIEEAPAPGLKESTRKQMAKTALRAGESIQYCNAGTIEFLVDEKENYYFMEMNTRLQVEHPVTEMICGLDLVEWQLRIAAKEKLPLQQKNIHAEGHAVEARLYAENPQKNFMPSAGHLKFFHLPKESQYIRIDSGFQSKDAVSVYYDPLLAKLIAWGKSRQEAILNLQFMLKKTAVSGIHSNIELLYRIISHPQFNKGPLNTRFILEHQEELLKPRQEPPKQTLIFAVITLLAEQNAQWEKYQSQTEDKSSPWFMNDNWRLMHAGQRSLTIWRHEQSWLIRIGGENKHYQLQWSGHDVSVEVIDDQDNELHLRVDGVDEQAVIFPGNEKISIFYQGEQWIFSLQKLFNEIHSESGARFNKLEAPMPGTLIEIFVQEGQRVKQGEPLFVIEAMKMEHVIKTLQEGKISHIHYKKGDRVQEGALLIDFDSDTESK